MMRKLGTVNPSKLEHAHPPDTRANATYALQMAPSISWVQGQILGVYVGGANDKKGGIYNDSATNGLQKAVYIAAYSGKTDALGNVFLGEDDADGALPTTGFSSYMDSTLEAYYGGFFHIADLTGLDAAAIVDFGARQIADKILIPT